MAMELYSVGLAFPKEMTAEAAVVLAKEAIGEAGFETGGHSVTDVWDGGEAQHGVILLDVEHDVMHGRSHAVFRKGGVEAEIEMP